MTGCRVRGVSIDPAAVLSIAPQDLNIIVQRLPLADAERFDLIVATNILVYYDAFDQALALANIASMLRPGGYFLTNYAVAPSAAMEAVPGLTTPVFFDGRATAIRSSATDGGNQTDRPLTAGRHEDHQDHEDQETKFLQSSLISVTSVM